MPRVVRNFFTTLHVDGRKSTTRTGPRSSGGGFDQDVFMRIDGEVDKALEIQGRVDSDGALVLRVFAGHMLIYEKRSVR
jgi:hypothetical protein